MFKNLLIKAVLYAIALIWLIPALGIGVHLHGDFLTGVLVAVGFAFVTWLVWVVIELLIVGTLGLAGCLMVFLWWLVPAVCLHFTSELFPASLTIDSKGAAIAGGLVLMVMSFIAKAITSNRSSSSSN